LQNPYEKPTVMDEEDEEQEEEEDDPRLYSGIEDNNEDEEDDPRLYSGIEDNNDLNDDEDPITEEQATCMECQVNTMPEVAGGNEK